MFQYIEPNIISKANVGYTTYTIPSGTISIIDGISTNYAFLQVRNEDFSVIFEPNCQITYVGSYSFYSCIKLEIIDFSNCKNLISIKSMAFSMCSMLKTVIFPVDVVFFEPASIMHIFSGAYIGTNILTKSLNITFYIVISSPWIFTFVLMLLHIKKKCSYSKI